MTLAEQLERAIDEGDLERVRELIVAAAEKDRRRAWTAIGWARLNTSEDPQAGARRLASLGTAPARWVSHWSWTLGKLVREEPQATGDLLVARGPRFVGALQPTEAWPLIRLAISRGVTDHGIDEDEITRGKVAFSSAGDGEGRVYRHLTGDEEALAHAPRIFEVDCGTELLRSCQFGDDPWTYAMKRLTDEGRLERQAILDASLDALTRDFRPTRIRWYADFHDALEPTSDERAARLDAYLELLASPAPPVVKAGLRALEELGDAVPPEQLAQAAPGPLGKPQKNHAMQALRLLARALEQSVEARPALLEAAAHGVAHERPDVQERALALVEEYAADREATVRARAALLGYAKTVSPSLRARVEALTGISSDGGSETRECVVVPPPRRDPLTLELALAARPPLEPVESMRELIELTAALLEAQGDGDDAERFLDGVSRLCGEPPPERQVAGLLDRGDRTGGGWFWGRTTAMGTVETVARAWVTGHWKLGQIADHGQNAAHALHLRGREVAKRAANRQPQPLLAFPTHRGGWIDPAVLAARERELEALGLRPEEADGRYARLRATTLDEPRLDPRLRAPWFPNGRAARPILMFNTEGERSAPEPVQAMVRALCDEQEYWQWEQHDSWSGWDPFTARWFLTIFPSLPGLAFAGAAAACASIEHPTPTTFAPIYGPEAVFEYGLDPIVPLGSNAWLAVAAGLAGRGEIARRSAADLTVQAVTDGRFNAAELGRFLSWLASSGIGTLARLAAPLRDIGRVSELHSAQMTLTVDAFMATLQTIPDNLHMLFGEAVELAARSGARIELPAARRALENVIGAVSASSKTGQLARDLLAR